MSERKSTAGSQGHSTVMNYQHWDGYRDPRFGYGSMLHGFVDHAPTGVMQSEKASVDVHVGVPFGKKSWLKGAHRVCFTMWETDVLPHNFVRWLGQYDQILVPCEHNVELFGQHHGDVRAVPLGVDQSVWSPGPDPSGRFTVLAGGSLWFRKGLDAVVKAFASANIPDSVLQIKAAPHAQDVPKSPFPKNVELLRYWMGPEQQVEWFRSGHVFLAPARGEGFGLIPLQAISTGIPTIVTATSGQAQFSHLATGVVPTRKVPAYTIGCWDEPDVDVLTELLVDHYRNWVTHRETALRNAVLADEFSWSRAAKKLVAAVPAGRLLKTSVMVDPDVQVEARFARRVDAVIGAARYQFVEGEVAVIPEGVFQVLWDSGAVAR